MTDTPVLTDTKEDEKKEKPIGLEVREKTFQQILKEQADERSKPLAEKPPEKTAEEKKAEEDAQAIKADEAVKKAEADKLAAEEKQAQLAKTAAEEVIKKQDEQRQAELDKIRREEDDKKRKEDLKPAWQKDPNAPKDEKGNPLPRSYDEIQAESVRIAKEEAKAEILAELEAREKTRQDEAAKLAAAEQQTKAQQDAAKKAAEDQLQKELDADLTDLYATNKLPKITNQNDPNDPGNKEFRNLFETAQKVNAERMAKGEQPIRSIKLIYYEHYKPLGKPAGHDAPVLGNVSPISQEAPEDKYIISRDRNKPMAQLVKEEAARISRVLNIRSK